MSKIKYTPWEHDYYMGGFDWPSPEGEPSYAPDPSPYSSPMLSDWVILGHGPMNIDNNE